MTYVAASANQRTQTIQSIICEDEINESVWEGVAWRLNLDNY